MVLQGRSQFSVFYLDLVLCAGSSGGLVVELGGLDDGVGVELVFGTVDGVVEDCVL